MITKGQKINDRYEIIRSIGEGGMANVYLGYDTILDRNVAIKVLRGDLSNDEKFVRRFQREALSASSLAHPNIVEMYDVGEDDGTYYIVMEYVEGKTLKQLLKKRGTLTLSETIDIMSQLTDGMAHAHDSYIIHRDLKPQNIMIKDDGQIKITDFGIAMALNATQLTQTNSVMGSVHYLPPEQASGKGSTIKSDIYSMGIIFYELLSGSLPFRGDNAVEIALKHMRDPLPSLRAENSAIPQSIENIIKRATAKNPKNRYESAREMHEDLLTALNDERMNEEEIQFKYPEHEEVKKTKKTEPATSTVEEDDDDDVAKKEKIEQLENESSDDNKIEKRNKIIIIVLGVIFLLIIIVLMLVFLLFPKLSNGKTVKVPDCTGDKVSVCEEKLLAAGFEVNAKIETVASDAIDKNKVVKTDPSTGRSIKKGTSITIYKSIGEETFELDDYTDQDSKTVKAILETKYGLIVTIEKKEPDDKTKEYEDDVIIGQNLAKGSEVKKGDSLVLYVPSDEKVFPDFVTEGYTKDDVDALCKEYNLNCTFKEEQTEKYAEGKIISQSRLAGSTISRGSNLSVTYAIKPKPVPTPSPEPEEESSGE